MGTPLITKAFLLTAVSKKAAHFPLFVKHYFEKSYKKLSPAFLRDPAFLNLMTLAFRGAPCFCQFHALYYDDGGWPGRTLRRFEHSVCKNEKRRCDDFIHSVLYLRHGHGLYVQPGLHTKLGQLGGAEYQYSISAVFDAWCCRSTQGRSKKLDLGG